MCKSFSVRPSTPFSAHTINGLGLLNQNEQSGLIMRLNVFIFVLLLGIYATLCIIKNGERLDVIIGEVQQCDTLMGSTLEGMSHATIKTKDGNYIIATLRNCAVGLTTEIYINRGALYFNTVYTTE